MDARPAHFIISIIFTIEDMRQHGLELLLVRMLRLRRFRRLRQIYELYTRPARAVGHQTRHGVAHVIVRARAWSMVSRPLDPLRRSSPSNWFLRRW